jgi:hypothetical protein
VPGLYYWFPIERDKLVNERAGRLNLDSLAGFDAAYIFEGRDVVPDQTVWMSTDGPGGNLGTLLYPKPIGETELPKCFYDPESQDWVRFKGYWIGREKGNLPLPTDLLKRVPMLGYGVKDKHGNQWTIPIIHGKSGRSSLPVVYSFDENGNSVVQRRKEDERLWELSGNAMDCLTQRVEFTDEQINRMTVEIIGINHYFGNAEVFAMATWGYLFLESNFVGLILEAVVDFQVVQEFLTTEKKTTQPS